MAYFSRVIFIFFFVHASSAFSAVTYTVSWASFTASGSSVNAAASIVAQQYTNAKYPICVSAQGQTLSTDSARVLSVSGLTVVFERYVTPTDSCNTPLRQSTVTASQSGVVDPVQCPTGQTRDSATNTCLCDYDRQVGTQFVSGDTNAACLGTCTIYLVSGWYDKTANITWGKSWIQNGASCSASDKPVVGSSDPYPQAASKCDAGTCPGTVNGQSVCVACSSSRENTKTKDSSTEVSTPASGASSATSSTSSGSSTTKCEGDKCTTITTTTTTNPDGLQDRQDQHQGTA